jgi:hypothetical protein
MQSTCVLIGDRFLDVSGIVAAGIEGDSSIPRGTRRVLEISELLVEDVDGNDVTDELAPSEREECEDALVRAFME